MAVVGEAHVIVRAITNRVRDDIQKEFNGIDTISRQAGRRIGDSFAAGLGDGVDRRAGGGLFSPSFRRAAEAARLRLNSLITIGYSLGPAISGVVGAIGALGVSLVTLVAALSAATPALFALGGAFAALVIGAGTLRLAFGGVGAAISAGGKAAGGAASNTRALERAERALADAIRRRNEFLIEADKMREEAERAAIDAVDALVDAQENLKRSERAYTRLVRRSLEAQEDVTKAREDAKEALQQLRFELEGGAISEKKARLEFEKARESLQRVQDLPPNSRARQEAELAFAEAELNLRKAIDRNQDLQKEEAEATRLGVEGSSRVQDALYAEAEAAQAVADAQVDLARERRDLAKQETATGEAVAFADTGVEDEIEKRLKELNRAIKDARRNLDDLRNGVGGAGNAFADAMAKLSPEAREFVNFILNEFKPAIKELRDAAGREFFPKLITALRTIKDELFPVLEPLLQETGSVLGDIAINLADVITETENLDRLQRVWKTSNRLLVNFGNAAGNLYELFLILLDAAEPLIIRFGEWIETLTGNWAQSAEDNFSTLRDTFNTAGDIIARLGGIFSTTFAGIRDVIGAALEGGAVDSLLTFFEEGAQAFADFAAAGREDGSLGQFLLEATINGQKVLSLLTNLVAEILKLGDDEGVGAFVDSLSRGVDILGEIGGRLNEAAPSLGEFIEKFLELTLLLTESGAIENFFAVLNTALDVVNAIFSNKIVAQVFALAASIFAVTRGLSIVTRVGKFFGKALVGNFLAVTGGITNAGKRVDAFGRALSIKGASKAGVFGKALGGAGKAVGGLGKGLRIAGFAFKAFLGPIGLILIAVELLLPIFQKLYNENERFREIVDGIIGFITNMFSKFMEIVGQVYEAIKPLIDVIGGIIEDVIGGAIQFIMDLWKELEPVVSELWGQLQPIFKIIGEAIDTLIGWYIVYLQEQFKIIATVVQTVWDFLKPIFAIIGQAIISSIVTYVKILIKTFQVIKTVVSTVWNFLKPIFQFIGNAVKNYITFYVEALKKSFNAIKTVVQGVWNFVRPIFNRIGNAIETAIGGAVSIVKGLIDGLKNVWDRVISGIKSAWNSGPGGFGFDIPGWVPVVGGKTFRIPTLAEGGVVSPRSGGTLALIAEAGRSERVEPLDPNGLSARDKALIDYLSNNNPSGVGSAVINVYPSAGMNERELAQKVSRELVSMMRKGAA